MDLINSRYFENLVQMLNRLRSFHQKIYFCPPFHVAYMLPNFLRALKVRKHDDISAEINNPLCLHT